VFEHELMEVFMSLKFWIRASAIATLSLTLSATIAVAQGNGHGHDKHDRDDHDQWRDRDRDEDHGHGRDHGHGHAYGHEKYRDHDSDIHGWYRAHYSHLPRGLAKRDRLAPGLERQLIVNGTLPPGLRAKAYPCPRELEVVLPPPPPNFVHVVIGGNLVLYNRANFQITDVFHFDVN
jgi:Ni/Co efflux regulator RcnB